MKQILKLVLLLVFSQVAIAQAPSNYTNINGRYRWIAGMFDSTFHIPKGTSASLRTGGSTNAGALFYNTTDSTVYTYTGTQWIKLRGVIIDTTSLSNRINLKLNISDTAAMLAPYLRKVDTASLSNRINLKLNISDTATMLGNYLNNVGYGLIKVGQVVTADSATLSSYFLRRKDSLTTTNPLGYVTRTILADTAAAIRSSATSGFVPYTGATQNVNLGQFGLTTKFVQFDTSSQAVTDRRLQWSNDDGTLQFGMTNGATITQRVGLEQFARVKNVQGSQINKGQVVYISGASGDRASVKLADNRADSTSSRTLGVATEDIPINDVGLVGTFGVVSNLNLAAYTPGDVLYLDSIPGGLTKTKPQAPYHIVFIGVVERANAGNGQLFTNVQNGYELEELHNVRITSPVRNNALLVYDSTRSLWIDTTIAQAGLAVTQVNTNSGSGITGGPITTVGTIAADTLVLSTRAWRQKGIDSVQGNLTAGLALKLNISDTANMLLPYLRKVDTASLSNRINLKVNISDTANMLNPYLRKVDTASLSNRINTKLNISDTATMLGNYVNNVGYGLSKVSQVVNADSATLASYFLRRKDSLTATNLLGYVTGKILADTAAAVRAAAGTIGGSGTTNRVSKFTASGTIGNSSIADSSSSVAMTILSNGNIGINTTAPNERLEIVGTSRFTRTTSPSVHLNLSMENGFAEYDARGSIDHVWETSGVERMRLTFGGNLGVGTASPDSMLTVLEGARFQRGVRMSGLPSAPGTRALRIDANGTLSVADTTTGGGGIGGSGTTNYLSKFTASTTLGNSQLFDDGTNVGISTSTAGSKLQVNGNAAIGYSASTAAPANGLLVSGNISGGTNYATRKVNLNMSSQSTFAAASFTFPNAGVFTTGEVNVFGTNDVFFQGLPATTSGFTVLEDYNGGGLQIGTGGTAKPIIFNINRVERMRLDASSNLGIGTATIGSRLQVNGNAAIGYSASTAAPTNGLAVAGNVGVGTSSITNPISFIRVLNISGGDAGIIFSNTNGTAKNWSIGAIDVGSFVFFDGSSERMRITSGGNVGINTTTIGSRLQVNGNAAIGYSASTAAPTNGLAVSGDVGIGTNTPSRYGAGGTARFLEIYNTATAANSQAHLVLSSGATTNIGAIGSIMFALPNSGTSDKRAAFIQAEMEASGATTNANLRFYTTLSGSFTNNLYLKPGGGVGIETITVGSALQVNGNAAIGYSASTAAPTNGLSISGNTTIGTTTAAGKFTIDPDDNQVGLAITGTSLTGSNAQSLIDLAQTWNTTGNPTAIKLNITNTASGATANLMDLQVGGTSEFKVTKAGYVGINQGTPTSMLHTQGSVATAYSSKTATYTLDSTDYTVVFNVSSAVTANLPDATTCTGRIYVIKINNTTNTDAVTIDPNGAQTIDGNATYTIHCQYGIMIQSDGANWRIIADFGAGLNCL